MLRGDGINPTALYYALPFAVEARINRPVELSKGGLKCTPSWQDV